MYLKPSVADKHNMLSVLIHGNIEIMIHFLKVIIQTCSKGDGQCCMLGLCEWGKYNVDNKEHI